MRFTLTITKNLAMKIIKRIHFTDSECIDFINGKWELRVASPSSYFKCGQWLAVLPSSSRGAMLLGSLRRVKITKLIPVCPLFLDDDLLIIEYLPELDEMPQLGLSGDRIYRNLESF